MRIVPLWCVIAAWNCGSSETLAPRAPGLGSSAITAQPAPPDTPPHTLCEAIRTNKFMYYQRYDPVVLGCRFAIRNDSQTERIRANPTRIRNASWYCTNRPAIDCLACELIRNSHWFANWTDSRESDQDSHNPKCESVNPAVVHVASRTESWSDWDM